MDKQALVSACIITYNQEAFIRQCLDGAVGQVVNFPYEILISDDRSTDNTLKICQEYALRYPGLIKFIEREKNLGMANNWSYTILSCTGKYIALCEGDDYWTDPHKLQKQVDFMELHPDFSAVTANTMYLKGGQLMHTYRESKEMWLDVKYPSELSYKDIASRVFPHTSSWLFRNVVKKFPEAYSRFFVADLPLFLLLSDAGKVKFADEVVSVYRIHDTGAVGRFRKIDKIVNLASYFDVLVEMNDHFHKKYSRDTEYVFLKEAYRFVKEHPVFESITAAQGLLNTYFKHIDRPELNGLEKIRLFLSYLSGITAKPVLRAKQWIKG